MSEQDDNKPIRHKIGGTRTIQTAVLVCEFLLERFSEFPRGTVHYHFLDPTPQNGFWSADIIVDLYGAYDAKKDKRLSEMVEVCRAFVAGRGEIW